MDYGYSNNQYTTTTSYSAQGGTGGGGFMGGESSSPSGAKGYGKDTLRPVTIQQVLTAAQPHPDADFKVDGHEITQITFVGQIRNISTQTTNITYKLDDGTGVVEVKQWIDTDTATGNVVADHMDAEGSAAKQKLVESAYARVYGRLKAFNNKRHVGAHVIRPITDYNEINYHLLEATAVHLFFTRGPPNANGTTSPNNPNQHSDIAQGETGLNGKPLPHLSPMGRKLYQTMKNTPQSNEGLHVQNLAQLMGVGVNEAYKASEELVGFGLIFTTVDDNTWALLEF